jgi:hypothetical protein
MGKAGWRGEDALVTGVPLHPGLPLPAAYLRICTPSRYCSQFSFPQGNLQILDIFAELIELFQKGFAIEQEDLTPQLGVAPGNPHHSLETARQWTESFPLPHGHGRAPGQGKGQGMGQVTQGCKQQVVLHGIHEDRPGTKPCPQGADPIHCLGARDF